jgi:type IV fimbrial biogenesis protein FimT
VDLCFPTPAVACDDKTGAWSTPAAAAGGDPEGVKGFKSIFRSAGVLPPTDILKPQLLPAGSNTVYYTELGWVDTTVDDRINRIVLDPAAKFKDELPTVALVISLAGMAVKCDPTKSTSDSRGCPP